MSTIKTLELIGYASGIAASNPGCGAGPIALKDSPYLSLLQENGLELHWDKILKPTNEEVPKLAKVTKLCIDLAQTVNRLVEDKKFFAVLGGDHSCAVGTWSGAAHAIREQGTLGLIWIDAHMDSHTLETSQTGNIHGMPLASLLGHGVPELTQILDKYPKLDPKHLCLIGVRSFESGEKALLERLKVRIFYMDEVKKRGLDSIMKEALQIVSSQTARFGVSLDIDSIDPSEAPGTGVKEPDGIPFDLLCNSMKLIANHAKLIGIEVVEFNPQLDLNHLTEKLIPKLILALTIGK